jgi:hypothetical protein
MSTPRVDQQLLEAMAKHLPPSGAALRLVDVAASTAESLRTLRPDIEVVLTPTPGQPWGLPPASVDAVTGYDVPLDAHLLAEALNVLRPGGRLILMNSHGSPAESHVHTLEAAGYTRILVETGAESPLPVGVLMRGEKPHTEAHTLDRARQVAAQGESRRGRYLHLLIRQTPDKPVWRIQPGEVIDWQAVGILDGNTPSVLGFSSLPKAVEFMQPAVLAGQIVGVNKIAKFRWEVADAWPFPVTFNPSLDIFRAHSVTLLRVDPASAESPDE